MGSNFRLETGSTVCGISCFFSVPLGNTGDKLGHGRFLPSAWNPLSTLIILSNNAIYSAQLQTSLSKTKTKMIPTICKVSVKIKITKASVYNTTAEQGDVSVFKLGYSCYPCQCLSTRTKELRWYNSWNAECRIAQSLRKICCGLDNQIIEGSNQKKRKLSLQNTQTGPGTHPVSFSIVASGCFSGVKAAGCRSGLLAFVWCRGKELPSYVFTAWGLIKEMYNFTFSLKFEWNKLTFLGLPYDVKSSVQKTFHVLFHVRSILTM
jgi:hypothetical protein